MTSTTSSLASVAGLTAAVGVVTPVIGGGGVFVADNADIVLGGSSMSVPRYIAIVGNGASNSGIADTGSLVDIGANNTLLNTLDLRSTGATAATNWIGVAAAGSLNVSSSIIGTTSGTVPLLTEALNKLGQGSLTFSGNTPNLYTGLTTVSEGTLNLNKLPGVFAIDGGLTIGDNIDAQAATVFVNSPEQINPGTVATPTTDSITSTGSLVISSGAGGITATDAVDEFTVQTAGTYTLTYGGQVTETLPFNATASQIQAALQALPLLGGSTANNIIVSGIGGVGATVGAYAVTFGGALGGSTLGSALTSSTGTVSVFDSLQNGGLSTTATLGTLAFTVGPDGAGSISVQTGTTLALNGTVTVSALGRGETNNVSGAMITGAVRSTLHRPP